MPRELTPEEHSRVEQLLSDDLQLYHKILLEPDDVSAIVRGHAFIEALLEGLLERDLPRKRIVRWYAMDMPRRLEIARASGTLRDESASAILALTEIRNGLAHNPGFTLLEKDVEKFEKAMAKAMPAEIYAIKTENASGTNLFRQFYGEHGRVLRVGIVLLKLELQGVVEARPIDALSTLAAIEESLSRPLPPGPHKISSTNLPFDAAGRRRRRGDAVK